MALERACWAEDSGPRKWLLAPGQAGDAFLILSVTGMSDPYHSAAQDQAECTRLQVERSGLQGPGRLLSCWQVADHRRAGNSDCRLWELGTFFLGRGIYLPGNVECLELALSAARRPISPPGISY